LDKFQILVDIIKVKSENLLIQAIISKIRTLIAKHYDKII